MDGLFNTVSYCLVGPTGHSLDSSSSSIRSLSLPRPRASELLVTVPATMPATLERPRALPGALVRGVPHPRVRRAGRRPCAAAAVRPVVPAPARAEALHRQVPRREHQREAAGLCGARRGRERRELGQLQALPQRARLVRRGGLPHHWATDGAGGGGRCGAGERERRTSMTTAF